MLELYADGVAPNSELINSLIVKQGIRGFTANPSLCKNYIGEGWNYEDYSKFIIDCSGGLPVSVQVLSSDSEIMLSEALTIASWGQNVYVKIPVVNIEGKPTTDVVLTLLKKGVKVNVTAIFLPEQVSNLLSCIQLEQDMETPLILSIFSGRIGDAGVNPNEIIKQIAVWTSGCSFIKLLWAGVRSVTDIREAGKYCDIITLPQAVLDKLPLNGKDLTQFCIETVQMFDRDSKNFTI